MGKYHRLSPMSAIRSFRWWSVTYGSFKPFKHPLMFWFRTPPFSVLAFAAGAAVGGYYVWGLPVSCATANLLTALHRLIGV